MRIMGLIAKNNLSLFLGIIIFLIILLGFTWLCVLTTDFIRYKTQNIPIFAYDVNILDEENGHTEVYDGIGYKYVYKEIEDNTICEFYILGSKI